jgi:hypothetical protein
MNKTDDPIDFKLIVGDVETPSSIAPHAMHTLVY